LASLAKKLDKRGSIGSSVIKIREKIDIADVTSVGLSRGGKSLEVMLRTSGQRQRSYMMSNNDQRLQMCWAIRQSFKVQTQKNIKVFDENGDEFSKKLDELCI
jgi:hypothetical protein